jgi:DNA-binding MarR family transcriptional regulator
MTSRKEQLEELLESFQMLKRNMSSFAIPKESAKITFAQWMALRLLAQRDGQTIKEVATALGISSSAATQLVDPLVRGGYISRKQSIADRRSVQLTLSKKAVAKMAEMKKRTLARLVDVFSVLNNEEFKHYIEINKKISQAMLQKDKRGSI